MLEYYDFFIYVALTSTLTNLFLPSTDRVVASMAGVATFGIAYIARPLGTLIFSPMSDRIGRKKTFVITLVIMGVATVGIGCLPTYAVIGAAAPVALLILRVIQGVALGGEYGSAVVYVMEHSEANRKGMATSVLQSTATVGLLCALLIVSILKLSLEPHSFSSWGWRVPFLVSAPIVVIATWIRLGMTETPTFTGYAEKQNIVESDFRGDVRPSRSHVSFSLHVHCLHALFSRERVEDGPDKSEPVPRRGNCRGGADVSDVRKTFRFNRSCKGYPDWHRMLDPRRISLLRRYSDLRGGKPVGARVRTNHHTRDFHGHDHGPASCIHRRIVPTTKPDDRIWTLAAVWKHPVRRVSSTDQPIVRKIYGK
jgi:hypothetical protein